MDLDPMISNSSDDENNYANYDNRPIRPMDQDALNQALARLPILIDEEDSMSHSDMNTSIKIRRQPILAHSTRRPKFSAINNINQSALNTSETPMSNKRKLGGCTPMNKLIKQVDAHQDFIQLKEENKTLEETTANLQAEYVSLRKSHANELETLEDEHQQAIDVLIQEHNLQREEWNLSLADKEQLLSQTNLELDNVRNDHTMLLLEKETLDKIVAEYQLIKEEMSSRLTESEITIKNLQEQIEKMKKPSQQKQSTFSNGRMPLKETSTDRSRTVNNSTALNSKNDPNRFQSNTKTLTTQRPVSTTKPSVSKTKLKTNMVIDETKKSTSTDKHLSTRVKPKIVPKK